jgi:hypothetical protein
MGQFDAKLLLASHEQDADVMLLCSQNGAFDLRLRGFIRPHGVYRDDGWHGLGVSV